MCEEAICQLWQDSDATIQGRSSSSRQCLRCEHQRVIMGSVKKKGNAGILASTAGSPLCSWTMSFARWYDRIIVIGKLFISLQLVPLSGKTLSSIAATSINLSGAGRAVRCFSQRFKLHRVSCCETSPCRVKHVCSKQGDQTPRHGDRCG